MTKQVKLPFSKKAKHRGKKRSRSARKILSEVKYLAKYLLETEEPMVYEVLEEECRFLRHFIRLTRWYGASRVQLKDYEILLDGRRVVKCKIPKIYASYGLAIPTANS